MIVIVKEMISEFELSGDNIVADLLFVAVPFVNGDRLRVLEFRFLLVLLLFHRVIYFGIDHLLQHFWQVLDFLHCESIYFGIVHVRDLHY